MSRLYISSTQELPAGYTPFAATASEPQIVHHEGRKYTFLGNYQTQYSCLDRVGIGLLAFVKTFFTLGFSLILSSVRDEWSAVFTGKKIVHVYANEILSVLKGNKSEVKELSALKTMVGTLTEQGTLGGSQKRVGVFLRGYRKKAALFQKGFEQFQKMNCASSLETFRLKNGYSMSERFNSSNPLNLKCTHEFFDYAPTTGFDDYWVDFANAALGGGCFHTGFVQEEIMVAEMPDFANHIASHIDPVTKHCTISTRSGGSDRDQVMKGAPHPYLMKGLTRVLSIDSSKVYGSQFDSVSDNDLLKAAPALDPPQKVNVLAVAAPRLSRKSTDVQWADDTLEDNCRTILAGLTLVQQEGQKSSGNPPHVHSGKLGCGVFNNCPHALFLIHCLIAQHKNMAVTLHGYSTDEAAQYRQSWNAIVAQLAGKTLKECLGVIAQHLRS